MFCFFPFLRCTCCLIDVLQSDRGRRRLARRLLGVGRTCSPRCVFLLCHRNLFYCVCSAGLLLPERLKTVVPLTLQVCSVANSVLIVVLCCRRWCSMCALAVTASALTSETLLVTCVGPSRARMFVFSCYRAIMLCFAVFLVLYCSDSLVRSFIS